MDDWTRVLLYGSFDGFGWSTDGDDNILLVLDNGDKVEIPSHFVKNASDFVEKNQIKLKDVIARIKQLDIGARKVWLDEFLNELGSDYGTLKYKAGYEQGKLEGAMEREKPVVPQFVADFYEDIADEFYVVLEKLVLYYKNNTDMPICKWFFETEDALTILINMHQFGYEVEKEEKKFLVKIKPTKHYFAKDIKGVVYFSKEYYGEFTKEELEKAGFGEVFNSPLFEVKEVE